MYDANQLPNLIRINFTVEHDIPSSDGAAYNTRLSDTHSAIGANWNEPHIGPAIGDPELTNVATGTWTWTKNPLSKFNIKKNWLGFITLSQIRIDGLV